MAFVSDGIDSLAHRPLSLIPGTADGTQPRTEYVAEFFDSHSEYRSYADEFDDRATDRKLDRLERELDPSDDVSLGTLSRRDGRDLYALLRKLAPECVVETGVCNGLSTFYMLLALDANDRGRLYSIDYPYRNGDELDAFREDTFSGYGGAAIPEGKDPGWIVPDELRDRWELRIGKSQRVLPELLVELDTVDAFFHDSEHSHPCMMFEFEATYERLGDGGVVLSDDVGWNDAFDIFTEVRADRSGRVSDSVGFARKRPAGRGSE